MQNASPRNRVCEDSTGGGGGGLDIELRKKFQGREFRDFYELDAKVTEYEELCSTPKYTLVVFKHN